MVRSIPICYVMGWNEVFFKTFLQNNCLKLTSKNFYLVFDRHKPPSKALDPCLFVWVFCPVCGCGSNPVSLFLYFQTDGTKSPCHRGVTSWSVWAGPADDYLIQGDYFLSSLPLRSPAREVLWSGEECGQPGLPEGLGRIICGGLTVDSLDLRLSAWLST